jgi:serpin B
MTARHAITLLPLLVACSSNNRATGAPPAQPTPAEPEPAAAVEAPAPEAEPAAAFADAPPLANVGAPTPAQLGAFARASNAFAVDMYEKARGEAGEGNLVFSPASIELAFGMTWAGARGATADEMRRVLHLEGDADALHEAASRILASWNDPARETYELRVVNRLFGERTYTFEQPFLDLTATRYGAPFEPVDFIDAAEAQRVAINGWVEQQTNERIDELLPPDSLNGLTRLVLVNAVYFLGQWVHAFQESATRDDFFYAPAGARPTVRIMTQTHEHGYAEVGNVQVLEMPYRGEDLAMTIVLPRDREGLAAVEGALSTATIGRWVSALRVRRVEIHLPRFEIRDSRLPLTTMMPEMGMRLAFDRTRADFTGMANPPNPDEQLYITDAFHEAFVKVDEQGTEAAAATAVVMGLRGGPAPAPDHPIFRADHPFLFMIRDVRSGTILFMGRVTRPGS